MVKQSCLILSLLFCRVASVRVEFQVCGSHVQQQTAQLGGSRSGEVGPGVKGGKYDITRTTLNFGKITDKMWLKCKPSEWQKNKRQTQGEICLNQSESIICICPGDIYTTASCCREAQRVKKKPAQDQQRFSHPSKNSWPSINYI